MKVCFDVDGTLIHLAGHYSDTPRYEVIQLFKLFQSFGCEMYVWSGGGVYYAKRWAEKLGLDCTITVKGDFVPDIAVDDEAVSLGKVNMRV